MHACLFRVYVIVDVYKQCLVFVGTAVLCERVEPCNTLDPKTCLLQTSLWIKWLLQEGLETGFTISLFERASECLVSIDLQFQLGFGA